MNLTKQPEASNSAAALRERYPRFIYDSFSVSRSASQLVAEYYFTVPPDIRFKSTITFNDVPACRFVQDEAIDNLLFHVGLIESFSYWKATCSPVIEIRPGRLDADQLGWWNALLLKGMGEYFYVNQIPFTSPNFVTLLDGAADSKCRYACASNLPRRLLIPLGGGRDSAVAAKLFQKHNRQPGYMVLNAVPSALKVAASLGCSNPIQVTRVLDPRLLELNRSGFLNGHVPFSANLAFINAACLALYGYSVIGIANERSSDEGNIDYDGQAINHQYSKSFAFEVSFNEYLKKYLLSHATYLSLVRPLYELQIGQLFSRLCSLHGVVSSCNRMQSKGTWCGECPKCLSVFVTTYPFVKPDDLIKIFGPSDFFANPASIPILRSLTGLEDHKPFECVATFDETIGALALCVQSAEALEKQLPCALQYAKDTILPQFPDAPSHALGYLSATMSLDALPDSIEAILAQEMTAL
jgi:hypothetical protein